MRRPGCRRICTRRRIGRRRAAPPRDRDRPVMVAHALACSGELQFRPGFGPWPKLGGSMATSRKRTATYAGFTSAGCAFHGSSTPSGIADAMEVHKSADEDVQFLYLGPGDVARRTASSRLRDE